MASICTVLQERKFLPTFETEPEKNVLAYFMHLYLVLEMLTARGVSDLALLAEISQILQSQLA